MNRPPIPRPKSDEYAEFYAGYIAAAPGSDPIVELERQAMRVHTGFGRLAPDELGYRYAPGKWTPLQMLGHLNDSERIFSYRALRFARGDRTRLPGMDQDEFVNGADFDSVPVDLLIREFVGLRSANVALWKTFGNDVLERSGIASDSPFTVRALIWITLGHVEHHVRVLSEKYALADRFRV